MSTSEDYVGDLAAEIDAAPRDPPIHDAFVELDAITDDGTVVIFDDEHIEEREGLYIQERNGVAVDLQEVR